MTYIVISYTLIFNHYLISFTILITCLLDNIWIFRGEVNVNHLWDFKGYLQNQSIKGKKSILPVLEQWTRRTLSNLDPQKCTAQIVSTDAHSLGLKQNRRVSNKNVKYMIMYSTLKLVVSK